MAKRAVLSYLMKPTNWWVPLLIILVISLAGVMMIGVQTYRDAPPVSDFVSPEGEVIVSKDDIVNGQKVFHRYALMDYGSMFGDGAGKGPDFTAEALHQVAQSMNAYYREREREQGQRALREWEKDGIETRVQKEIKDNRYQEEQDVVVLSDGQQHAVEALEAYYRTIFLEADGTKSFPPPGYIDDPEEIRTLSAFFFWGAWVCGVERPGESYSYTHNWPFDVLAGNTPTGPVLFWSVIGMLGLIIGLGLVLYYYGQMDELSERMLTAGASPMLSADSVDAFVPTPTQRATYKFFAAAIVLFLVQVLSGALVIDEFIGFLGYVGLDFSALIPVTVSRSWHIQLSLFWISACWIAASVFVLPFITNSEPKGQRRLVNVLFGLFVAMVGGSLFGMAAGPLGLIEQWHWLGNQGWEFMEFGKLYQVFLLVIFALWAAVVYRGVKPALKKGRPWRLPNWLVYATVSILVLLISGFIATPETNFVIGDFWRWMVIHMWVEAFFEVFTTIIVGYFMVLMGLVSRKATERVIYLAALLFLGSGLLGISHNFYWNAKPVATMALGSVFSTLQVVPLILLTLEAWRFRRMPSLALAKSGNGAPSAVTFGLPGVFWFLVAVNFWNFLGAGVFGLIINLPIVNYYEHGTYLTVNHGHAALMGVYGNLSLAGLLFCCRLLTRPARWNPKWVRVSFWSLNVGLFLMVILDLFPAGVIQLQNVLENGLWYARSNAFITSPTFQSLTWMRGIGGALFLFGGIVPLVWLVLTRVRALKPRSGAGTLIEPTCQKDCNTCQCKAASMH